MNDSITNYIFRKLLSLDSSRFSLTTFNVFLQLFYRNNEIAEKIKKKDWIGSTTYYATTVDLIGMDNMYVYIY
jgi:hypothetical protein